MDSGDLALDPTWLTFNMIWIAIYRLHLTDLEQVTALACPLPTARLLYTLVISILPASGTDLRVLWCPRIQASDPSVPSSLSLMDESTVIGKSCQHVIIPSLPFSGACTPRLSAVIPVCRLLLAPFLWSTYHSDGADCQQPRQARRARV
jgi:hypothetical protein